MNLHHVLALSLIAATGAALADTTAAGTTPLTRTEVARSVIAARAAGQLRPAGDAAEFSRPEASGRSTLSRDDVAREVLAARAAGALPHAGEMAPEEVSRLAQANAVPSTLTRAEVKAEVLQARANGELVPAGEDVIGPVAHRRVADTHTAIARNSRAETPAVR